MSGTQQHFLRDTAAVRRLLATVDLSGRTVVEIGVGTGVLTGLILERGPERVIGYEVDPGVCALADPRLDLRIQDFRAADPRGFPEGTCLISFPPYALIPELIQLVEGSDAPFADAILMVRKRHLEALPSFHTALALPSHAFEPATEPGMHFVVRRGFRRRPSPT